MALTEENRAFLERVFPDEIFGHDHGFRLSGNDLELLLNASRSSQSAEDGAITDGRRFSTHAGERYRHVARGSVYTLPFGRAEAMLQCAGPIEDDATLLVYIGEDGMIYARPTHEFFDGRFEPLSRTPLNVGDKSREDPETPSQSVEVERLKAALTYWHEGAALIEACLVIAERGDLSEAPFGMAPHEARVWHTGRANAFRHALEMMGPTDTTRQALEVNNDG